MTTGTYGPTGSFAGINQANSYNSRLQPATLSASVASGTLLSLMYDFGLGTNDNGNVRHVWNEKVTNHSRDQAFTYDDLNRLSTAQSGTWGIQAHLDPWGNVVGTTGISGTSLVNTMPLPSDLSANGSNQPASSLVSYMFSGGNLTSDGTHSYTYDAEDRLKGVDSATYVYDGDGVRVSKSSGTLYWGGLAESDASGNITSEYVFLSGKRLARRDPATGNVYYYISDQLGSSSVVTDATGNIQNESDFYPYGGENTVTNNVTNQKYKFTGKERDSESGLDNFGARYYNSGIGRFMTPDWSAKAEPVPYAKMANPQSLNLYSYVGNNPESMTDPDGHLRVMTTGISASWYTNGLSSVNGAFETNLEMAMTATYMDVEEQAGSVEATKAKELQAVHQQSSGQGQSQSSGTPGVVTGAAADHQRAILLGMLGQLVPGDKGLDKELGSDCVAHGGNCTFSMTPDLKKEVNAAMGASPDFPGSTFGAHSREGFSPSLHHNHDGNEPDRLHIDHFNGRSVFGFLPHIIVDVSIGSLFYGSQKVFSY